jgi:hypothetical protein
MSDGNASPIEGAPLSAFTSIRCSNNPSVRIQHGPFTLAGIYRIRKMIVHTRITYLY